MPALVDATPGEPVATITVTDPGQEVTAMDTSEPTEIPAKGPMECDPDVVLLHPPEDDILLTGDGTVQPEGDEAPDDSLLDVPVSTPTSEAMETELTPAPSAPYDPSKFGGLPSRTTIQYGRTTIEQQGGMAAMTRMDPATGDRIAETVTLLRTIARTPAGPESPGVSDQFGQVTLTDITDDQGE